MSRATNLDVNDRLLLEAVLNDAYLKQLRARITEIYLLAIPVVVKGDDDKERLIWIDETNHPLLSKINELINERTEQIKNHFHASHRSMDNN